MAVFYEFGRFRLEEDRRRLLGPRGEVPLEPKLFEMLLKLVQDTPSPVTADKLRPDLNAEQATKLVYQSIYKLRGALHDKKKPYRIIKFRSTRGYEFVADYKRVDTDAPPTPTEPAFAIAPIHFSAIPRKLTLSTKQINPQGADFGYYSAPATPWRLRCRIATASPYFRLGFKLLGENGRLFGDGSMQSDDPNLIVHIGRNYWDRPGITKRDLFVVGYADGRRLDADKKVTRVTKVATVKVEFIVDSGYEARLLVDGIPCFRHVVPPAICARVAILAWADQDECSVDVTGLLLRTVDSK